MQDGIHGRQFEVIDCSGQTTQVGLSIIPESYGEHPGSFHVSSSVRPCPTMPYGPETWNRGSTPLSIFTDGGSMTTANSQFSLGRNPSLTHSESVGLGVERGVVSSSSNVSNHPLVLKERDYIGLSDSSSTSTQKNRFVFPAAVEQNCSRSSSGSDCKDTELKLSLGLSLGHQGDGPRDDVGSVPSGQRSTDERRSDCSSLETGVLKTCIIEKSPHPEQKRVPESLACVGKVSTKQCVYDKNGRTLNLPERVYGAQLHEVNRLHTPSECSMMQWSDEQYFLSQRSSARYSSVVENQNLSFQETYSSQQLSDFCRNAIQNTAGLSAQHIPSVENCYNKDGSKMACNDISRLEDPFGNSPSVGVRCNYEYRYPPRTVSSTSERNSNPSQAAQKPWPKVLPNDSLRNPSIQSGNIEFDAGSKGCEALTRSVFVLPTPSTTVPAKRPFFETIGDSRMVNSSEARSETRANASVVGAVALAGITTSTFAISNTDSDVKPGVSQATKVHPVSGLFSWNNVIPQPARRSGGAEKSKGLFSSNVPASPSSLPRVQTPNLKGRNASGDESAMDSPAEEYTVKQPSYENHNHSEDGRAQVVGWPPIRSFRKNTLASQKRPADQEQDPQVKPSDPAKLVHQQSTSLFVKANMDGVPIGRKIDLKSYDSYDSLKSALQEMFQRFMSGPAALGMVCASNVDQKQLNLMDGTEYVLTHEDKDGDWMLVGDVPWNMFVTTVKRLRIMKVSEAIGLGPKLKIKSNNNLVEGARGK